MKKISLFLLSFLILGSFFLPAQILFEEDFNSPDALDKWVLVDGDELPYVDTQQKYSWIVQNKKAASTSYFSNLESTMQANDWMISSAIKLTSKNIWLSFDARAQSVNSLKRDGYEVRISTKSRDTASCLLEPALFSMAAEEYTKQSRYINLENYADSTVYIAFRNNSVNKYVLEIDNIHVFETKDRDARLLSVNLPIIAADTAAILVEVEIENNGQDTLKHVAVNWSIDHGQTIFTDSLSLDLAPFEKITHTLDTAWKPSNTGSFTHFQLWTSGPNNQMDEKPANDTLLKDVFVVRGNTVKRRVLIENFSTAPCWHCPDALVILENVLEQHPDFIPVEIHAGFQQDGMTFKEAETYANAYTAEVPLAMFDRTAEQAKMVYQRSFWHQKANEHAQKDAVVNIKLSGTYSASLNEVSLSSQLKFEDYLLPGKIALTVFIVEDSVSKIVKEGIYNKDWDQVNGSYNRPGHRFQGIGIPFNNPSYHSYIQGYPHRFVLRDVYPENDAWGDTTVVTTNQPAPNDTFQTTYSFPLDSNWDKSKLYFVAFASYYDSKNKFNRSILNTTKIDFQELQFPIGEMEDQRKINEFEVYPNPSSGLTFIRMQLQESSSIEVSVNDLSGKLLLQKKIPSLPSGNQRVDLDLSFLPAGFYVIRMRQNSHLRSTKKILITK